MLRLLCAITTILVLSVFIALSRYFLHQFCNTSCAAKDSLMITLLAMGPLGSGLVSRPSGATRDQRSDQRSREAPIPVGRNSTLRDTISTTTKSLHPRISIFPPSETAPYVIRLPRRGFRGNGVPQDTRFICDYLAVISSQRHLVMDNLKTIPILVADTTLLTGGTGPLHFCPKFQNVAVCTARVSTASVAVERKSFSSLFLAYVHLYAACGGAWMLLFIIHRKLSEIDVTGYGVTPLSFLKAISHSVINLCQIF